MNLSELHSKLQSAGVPPEKYYMHELYGSTDDNDKLALTIRMGKYTAEYEVYFREKGQKGLEKIFSDETKACDFFYQKAKDEWTFEKILNIDGLGGMTVNERLIESGLLDEFDYCRNNDKTRARTILRWLGVDEKSIGEILK